ncbi:bifunctional phosphoribosylaminoimidazolecarboxamide formyltransferase/IMP cyclohydrolase [Lewinella cohaerens]|uniref:bifunctional phosphoribosylaminoimidazolecarboxamide formyltransferase/IMP cyclohydrolase n=1 Tax=Lewinella cohaerens TaxID=70995 RepID=UPI00037ABB8D|nr:bifunctional phosphoribosylaminoimidazolecarboxamide formyltransferase/IMP cyclohydrolase [Lewinella cohaerens]
MSARKIRSALISVYHKDGLDEIVQELHRQGVQIYSTGGTQKFIAQLDIPVTAVEDITSYPSILDGRVKTLHPAVFGGILARREPDHLDQLKEYKLPEIDLVIVDLYPFEETVATTNEESAIIEKIDIGGISLIRAAAKNYKDVVVVPSRAEYALFLEILKEKEGTLDLTDRREMARRAFKVSSNYDIAIFNYFNEGTTDIAFKYSIHRSDILRYGENPHQSGVFFGDFDAVFDKLNGKDISYNNLVDIDAAVQIMRELRIGDPAFAILKHTNTCGLAVRSTLKEAWDAALECDNVSAFGGIFICNTSVDLATAEAINELFYEVLIAPDFDEDALALLKSKKKRILLKLKDYAIGSRSFRSLLNGVVEQDTDMRQETIADLDTVTEVAPTPEQVSDLLFASIAVKHLKSNAIALVKNKQLIGMGCGQPSRVDALKQAINKAKAFGFDLDGAVMASDAFFPFPDCVEIADKQGIKAVIQPGGSIKDKDSIAYCDGHGMAMVMTGHRHFKH